jgi:hypothetical protein
MRCGTWNIRSLYRTSYLMAVLRELSRYRLDAVGVQVRWDGSGIEPAGEYTVHGKVNEKHELGSGFLCTRDNCISSYEG